MELLILVLYDALAVAILLMSVSRSSRIGFAQTITSFLGRIAAFFAALFIGKGGSRLIYKLFLDNRITGFLEEAISDSASVSDILESLEAASDTLPDFVANFYGISNSRFLEESIGNSIVDVVSMLEQEIVEPAVTGFIHIVLFLISFAVLCFLVHHFSKAVGLVFKLPIIKTVDRFLGGVLGVAQGCINLYLVVLVVRFILYFIGDPPALFNENMIMDTFLWSKIYEFNPFDFLK